MFFLVIEIIVLEVIFLELVVIGFLGKLLLVIDVISLDEIDFLINF